MGCFDDSTVFLKNGKNKEGTRLQSLETLYSGSHSLGDNRREFLPSSNLLLSLLFEVYLSTPVISHLRVLKH